MNRIPKKLFDLMMQWDPSAMQDKLVSRYQAYHTKEENKQKVYLHVTPETVTIGDIADRTSSEQSNMEAYLEEEKIPVLFQTEDGQHIVGIVNKVFSASPEVEARLRRKDVIQAMQPKALNKLDDFLEEIGNEVGLTLYGKNSIFLADA